MKAINFPKEKAAITLEFFWNQKLPVNVLDIISNIPYADINVQSLDINKWSCICENKHNDSYYLFTYNRNENIYRQRFSQAHMLGHFILGHLLETRVLRDETFDSIDFRDRDANSFTTELLMPKNLILYYSDKLCDIDKLSKKFNVSPWTIRCRLKELRIL